VIDITESLLIRLAGVRAFGQGLSSYEEGGVQNVVTTEKSTRAIVQDPGSHRVVLRHSHSMIEGECDCEVSDGIDFCQHCVAVALCLQDGLSTKKPVTKRQAMTAIRRYMVALSREKLLEEFMGIIGHDRSLRDDRFQRVQFASGGLSFADLKRMITNIELNGEPWEDQAVRVFFEEFEAILLCIREFADRLDSLVLLRTVEFAVRHFSAEIRFVGDYDDYGDYWDVSAELLFDLHLNAVSRLDWTPIDLESYLKDRCLSEDWHPAKWREDMQGFEEL